MATVNSRSFIDRLIAGNGQIDPEDAPDNPWAVRIVEFTNMAGRRAWGVVFEGERDLYRYELESEFLHDPKLIWTRKGIEELA